MRFLLALPFSRYVYMNCLNKFLGASGVGIIETEAKTGLGVEA